VTVERTQLEVAIMNLVVNARDAMPEGGTLRLDIDNVPEAAARHDGLGSTDLVVLAVTDTGIGMTPEIRRRVFEPFFTTKEVGRGTGLGLPMVHGFARQSGGTVTIESTPGAGTTVRIHLPRATAAAGDPPVPATPTPSPSPTGAAPARPLRVLLVDDDASVRAPVADMLRDLGHAVLQADSAEQAIRIVDPPADMPAGTIETDEMTAGPPELVVMDFAMPRMNGAELAHRLAAILPGLALVFITGFADSDTLDGWSAQGWPVLGKPFTQDALALAIERALRTASRDPAASATPVFGE
jgi:CheY-like chemotaxis protein